MDVQKTGVAVLEGIKTGFIKTAESLGKAAIWLGHSIRVISDKMWAVVKPILQKAGEATSAFLKSPIGIVSMLGLGGIVATVSASKSTSKVAKVAFYTLGLGCVVGVGVVAGPMITPYLACIPALFV